MADIAELVLAVNTKDFERAQRVLNDFRREAGQAEQASVKLASATKLVSVALGTFAGGFAGIRIADMVRESALLAARYETMGIVMRVAGNNAGYTMEQMEKLSKSLQVSGISMLESRNILTQLATANIDLSKATELGRAAQDLAVVGQMNSSDALSRLTYAIKSNQIEILRTLGLNVSFEEGYKKLATQLKVNVRDLTEQQRTLARTNEVLEASKAYQGIYEESMLSAGKAMTSLTRYWEDLKVKMGELFLPTVTQSVFDLTDALKQANAAAEAFKASGSLLDIGEDMRNVFTTTFQAVIVLGANVLYVIRSIVLEIKTIVEQVKALATLDFKKFGDLREEALKRAEADRKWIDQLSEGVANPKPKPPAVTVPEDERIRRQAEAKAKADAAAAAGAAEAYTRSLSNQTEKLGQTAVQTKMLEAAEQAAKAPTKELAAEIMAAAKKWADAAKLREDASKRSGGATKDLVKQSQDFVKSLKDDIEQIGLDNVQTRMLAAAKAALKAPTKALREEIMSTAKAWADSTVEEERRREALEQTAAAIQRAKDSSKAYVETLDSELAAVQQSIASEASAILQAYHMEEALHELEMQQLETAAAALELKAAQEDAVNEDLVQKYMEQANALRLLASMKDITWARNLSDAFIDVTDKADKYVRKIMLIRALVARGPERGGMTKEQGLDAEFKVQNEMQDEVLTPALETTKELKSAALDLGMTFQSAFENALIEGKKFSDVLHGLLQDIARVMIRKTLVEPMAKWASNSMSWLFGSSEGNVFEHGALTKEPVRQFRLGGVVNEPTLFPLGSMAEEEPEAIMPLRRGRDGRLGVASVGGGGGDNITISQTFTFQGNASRQEAFAIIEAARRQTLADIREAKRRGNALGGDSR